MSGESLNALTSRFRSAETERAYARALFSENFRHNTIAVIIALVLQGGYIFLDLSILENPLEAVVARCGVIALCLGIVATFAVKPIAERHEALTTMIAFFLACLMIFIIWREPTLDNAYYVGLIQGGVFLSFLLRISFLKAIATLSASLVLFILAVAEKADREEAILQTIVLATMFILCGFGVYLMQRYRRTDFLKSQMIERQNVQLAEMLGKLQRDNDRKIAAMNLLVHFVRTPIHQISGFTDVVLNDLRDRDVEDEAASSLECAQYIKKASADLQTNIAKLLAYHRLDEIDENEPTTRVNVATLFADALHQIEEDIAVDYAADSETIVSHVRPLETMANALREYYAARTDDIERIIGGCLRTDGGVTVTLTDNGSAIDAEDFADRTKPLTEIDNYLNLNGGALPMHLRTIAKAVAICGGALNYQRRDNRNVFTITLRDLDDKRRDARTRANRAA